MCSLEEAFGPITSSVPGMNTDPALRSYNTHGFDPMGPGQQAWNPHSNFPDVMGQPVTQSDNRRQYAQPGNGLEHKRWQNNWGQPNAAHFSRGVHSERSRVNRMGDTRMHTTSGAKVSSSADFPLNESPGLKFNQYPHDANYVPPFINALDGSAAPGAPVSSVGEAPRAAARRRQLKDTFGSISQPRISEDGGIGPVPNPSDYRNMHPTQWDNEISGAPVQPRQFSPGFGPSANMRGGNRVGIRDLNEMMMDAPTPKTSNDVECLQKQIRELSAKLDTLEKKMGKVENSRSHDIILIIVLVVFVLFIIDNVFGFNKLT